MASAIKVDERTAQLPKGTAALNWDGICRDGRPVERGTMKVRVRASADGEYVAEAKVFPVEWKADIAPAGPQGGSAGATAAGGTASGPVSAATGGSSSPANSGGSSSTPPGTVDNGSGGHTNNGVRDHGVGEGRDGAGQGQGADNGKK